MVTNPELREVTPWEVWLRKNLNVLTEHLALQIHSKQQCVNPACQMEKKQVAHFTQPLYLQLELNSDFELVQPSILELLVITQDSKAPNFTPRRILVSGEMKHTL